MQPIKRFFNCLAWRRDSMRGENFCGFPILPLLGGADGLTLLIVRRGSCIAVILATGGGLRPRDLFPKGSSVTIFPLFQTITHQGGEVFTRVSLLMIGGG